jgi:hypothetical protein
VPLVGRLILMATQRPSSAQLDSARTIVAAIQTIGAFKGDAEHSPAAMQTLDGEVQAKQAGEVQSKNAADAARDAAAASEMELYKRSLRVKELIIGQFGSDSDEAAAVGLKKKSERKSPTRKTPAPKV